MFSESDAYTLDAVYAVAKAAGRPLTAYEAMDAMYRIGRNDSPALLFDLFCSQCLLPDTLPAVVVAVCRPDTDQCD